MNTTKTHERRMALEDLGLEISRSICKIHREHNFTSAEIAFVLSEKTQDWTQRAMQDEWEDQEESKEDA